MFSSKWLAAGALSLGLAAALQAADEAPKFPSFGKIVRVDPRFDKLIPAEARLEKLAEGFEWTEGPVWFPEDGGYLLFSDIPRNSVFKWTEAKGISLFMKPSGYTGVQPRGMDGDEPGSNGLLRDAKGRLVMCEHGDRRVSRVEPDGGKLTLADRYEGKRLNSPNDVVQRANGDYYFTDPPYGMRKREKDEHKELDWFGVYRIAGDGTLTLLTKEMTRPNGIAFSPDQSVLYIAQSDSNEPIWKAFPVQSDGLLGKSRVFADARKLPSKDLPGGPDGMKVDKDGNIFATGPGGVIVFAPDGTHLGSILTGERTANCAWGDDGATLYITADMYLARVKTATKGAGW